MKRQTLKALNLKQYGGSGPALAKGAHWTEGNRGLLRNENKTSVAAGRRKIHLAGESLPQQLLSRGAPEVMQAGYTLYPLPYGRGSDRSRARKQAGYSNHPSQT
jgi:hypothetical protein